ncbi:MAG: WD40 repeat domain-containing protein [Acidobacteriota bacterium]|nr:WD40 repeat domain-containing protein [Acidobacteriota bacterium]
MIESVRLALRPAAENLLVVVDQFEELFRFAKDNKSTSYGNDAAAFVKLLLEATKAQANIYVVLTMRSDFLGNCSQFWDLPEAITESQYLIPRLTRDQLREVIEGPVAVGGGEIAPRLVNQLLNDIADNQDQLPILQHALMRTWDAWQETTFVVPPSGGNGCEAALPLVPSYNRLKAELQTRRPIDVEHYESIGGMASALSKHADEAFEKDLPDDRHRQIAERMFKALTEKGEDNREIRRPVEFGPLCAVTGASEEELKTVIEAFRESGRSFLMPPAGTELEETTLVDISHESMIRVWARLQQWTNEEAESAAIYLRLADAARRKAELWRGKDLQEAEDWLDKNTPTEVWAERYDSNFAAAMIFLRKSQTQLEEEHVHAEHRRRIEAERTKREVWLTRIFAATVTVMLLALLLIGGYSYWQIVSHRKLTYKSDMDLADQAYKEAQYGQTVNLLARYIPKPSAWLNFLEKDVRDQAWQVLWQLNHDEFATLQGHRGAVFSLAFSPDGKTLASGSNDNTIKFWNAHTGQLLNTLRGHESSVLSVSFSPDGKALASGSNDQTIKLWDARTGQLSGTLKGHENDVSAVAFSPDSKTLASGSKDNTIKLWDAQTSQLLNTLRGHESSVLSVSFSPNGKTFASGSNDNTIKLWDAHTGQLLNTLWGYEGSSVAFSTDGKTLASGSSYDTIKLWDVLNGQLLSTLEGHKYDVYSVIFSPDGKMLASGSDDQTIRLWDAHTGQRLGTLKGHENHVSAVAFSPDSRTLASASKDYTIKLWDVGAARLLSTFKEHKGAVSSLAFPPDGKVLASGSNDQTIKLWDAHTGKLLNTLEGHKGEVFSLAFSPDGKILASVCGDNTVRLWDARTGQLLNTLKSHDGFVGFASVAFSPDGKTLASGSPDRTIKLWDARTGQRLRVLEGHKEGVHSLAFSFNGKTLASGSYDNTIKLWDTRTGQLLSTLEGHERAVHFVAFSPDDKILASGSNDQTIKLWDAHNGQLLHTFSAYETKAFTVAFSPDGKMLASGSNDQIIKLWDVHSGQLLSILKEYEGAVCSLVFAPDSKTLVSGNGFGLIRLWWIAMAKEMARQQSQ